jgi:N-formylglutamate deformylase
MAAQETLFTLTRGTTPLLISFPHVGTDLPDDISARLTPAALLLADTDWHLPRLYDFAAELGASTIVARYSRYVIDLNRPPEDINLYPGQDTTGLVPVDTFRREPIYDGSPPDADEVAERRERYWRPYHEALATELARLKHEHGRVLLWDAHSIASELPRFFEGKLPDLNLGTVSGASCAPAIQRAIESALGAQPEYTWVANGRFKGGFITRNYGAPASGVHAAQLEMSQCVYMNEAAPFEFREELAAHVRTVLRRLQQAALDALP